MIRIVVILLLSTQISFGQSFAPAPGLPGSTAIHMDSSIFIDWAISVSVTRGPINIANIGLGLASYGVDSDAIGAADGVLVVALGDGGRAEIGFSTPIANGVGPDFAIFENGFIDHYMEFAFVEVSSDGTNFFRFESICEIPSSVQLTNFSISNCGFVNNLAGKYRLEYGTPFDLEELAGTVGLDVNAITHIRLIDVVGSIDPLLGSHDSQGNIINDPYPTEFNSGGFDLDAVGVIHNVFSVGIEKKGVIEATISPNPFQEVFIISNESEANYRVLSLSGELIQSKQGIGQIEFDSSTLPRGIYIVEITEANKFYHKKIIKK